MCDISKKPANLLLHACCGPCSMEPTRLLHERGITPHLHYANSNIHPAPEYDHRLATISAWADGENLPLSESPYDPRAWEEAVGRIGDAAKAKYGVIAGGVRGDDAPENAFGHSPEAEEARKARCRACYRLRFEETARFAAENGFDTLGTTLSVSPYQYTEVIREELERACAKAGIAALFEDYRPFYNEASRRSRAEGLYRQNYCGCRFSDEEAAAERAERKRQRMCERAAEQAARADKRAAAEAARRARKAERAAYDAKQARKRAVLKRLREDRVRKSNDALGETAGD